MGFSVETAIDEFAILRGCVDERIRRINELSMSNAMKSFNRASNYSANASAGLTGKDR
jgi:hypothetical protein